MKKASFPELATLFAFLVLNVGMLFYSLKVGRADRENIFFGFGWIMALFFVPVGVMLVLESAGLKRLRWLPYLLWLAAFGIAILWTQDFLRLLAAGSLFQE